MSFLGSLEECANASYKLSNGEKKLINSMIKNSPEKFSDIEKTIQQIMADGRIDLHDIPNIVHLVSQLFTIHFNIQNIDVTNIITFIVDVIIDMLPIPDISREIAITIANTSIILLKTNVNRFQNYVKTCC